MEAPAVGPLGRWWSLVVVVVVVEAAPCAGASSLPCGPCQLPLAPPRPDLQAEKAKFAHSFETPHFQHRTRTHPHTA